MTTTERAPSRRRWSKDAVRLAAWGTGAAAFLGSVAAIAVAPKPSPSDGAAFSRAEAPAVEQHVIRRIIVIPSEPSAPVAVLQEPAAPQPATAPPPAPATSTGGS